MFSISIDMPRLTLSVSFFTLFCSHTSYVMTFMNSKIFPSSCFEQIWEQTKDFGCCWRTVWGVSQYQPANWDFVNSLLYCDIAIPIQKSYMGFLEKKRFFCGMNISWHCQPLTTVYCYIVVGPTLQNCGCHHDAAFFWKSGLHSGSHVYQVG